MDISTSNELLDKAIQYIKDFCESEYGDSNIDLSDLSRVSVAYTDAPDDICYDWDNITAYIDLQSNRIYKELNGSIYTEQESIFYVREVVEQEEFSSLSDMLPSLQSLDFDELTDIGDNELQIYHYKAQTDKLFDKAAFYDMQPEEIENAVKEDVRRILAENNVNGGLGLAAIYGSRSRSLEKESSDLDVVIEVHTACKEDALFNIIHSEPIMINGITVDVNPIRPEESGTLGTYLQRAEQYLSKSQAQTQQRHRTGTPTTRSRR